MEDFERNLYNKALDKYDYMFKETFKIIDNNIETQKKKDKYYAIAIISVVLCLCLTACFFIYGYFWNNYNYPNTDNNIVNGSNNTIKDKE